MSIEDENEQLEFAKEIAEKLLDGTVSPNDISESRLLKKRAKPAKGDDTDEAHQKWNEIRYHFNWIMRLVAVLAIIIRELQDKAIKDFILMKMQTTWIPHIFSIGTDFAGPRANIRNLYEQIEDPLLYIFETVLYQIADEAFGGGGYGPAKGSERRLFMGRVFYQSTIAVYMSLFNYGGNQYSTIFPAKKKLKKKKVSRTSAHEHRLSFGRLNRVVLRILTELRPSEYKKVLDVKHVIKHSRDLSPVGCCMNATKRPVRKFCDRRGDEIWQFYMNLLKSPSPSNSLCTTPEQSDDDSVMHVDEKKAEVSPGEKTKKTSLPLPPSNLPPAMVPRPAEMFYSTQIHQRHTTQMESIQTLDTSLLGSTGPQQIQQFPADTIIRLVDDIRGLSNRTQVGGILPDPKIWNFGRYAQQMLEQMKQALEKLILQKSFNGYEQEEMSMAVVPQLNTNSNPSGNFFTNAMTDYHSQLEMNSNHVRYPEHDFVDPRVSNNNYSRGIGVSISSSRACAASVTAPQMPVHQSIGFSEPNYGSSMQVDQFNTIMNSSFQNRYALPSSIGAGSSAYPGPYVRSAGRVLTPMMMPNRSFMDVDGPNLR